MMKRAPWHVLITIYYQGLQTKLNEFGGENGMYGRGEMCVEGCGGETVGNRQFGRTTLNGKMY